MIGWSRVPPTIWTLVLAKFGSGTPSKKISADGAKPTICHPKRRRAAWANCFDLSSVVRPGPGRQLGDFQPGRHHHRAAMHAAIDQRHRRALGDDVFRPGEGEALVALLGLLFRRLRPEQERQPDHDAEKQRAADQRGGEGAEHSGGHQTGTDQHSAPRNASALDLRHQVQLAADRHHRRLVTVAPVAIGQHVIDLVRREVADEAGIVGVQRPHRLMRRHHRQLVLGTIFVGQRPVEMDGDRPVVVMPAPRGEDAGAVMLW